MFTNCANIQGLATYVLLLLYWDQVASAIEPRKDHLRDPKLLFWEEFHIRFKCHNKGCIILMVVRHFVENIKYDVFVEKNQNFLGRDGSAEGRWG